MKYLNVFYVLFLLFIGCGSSDEETPQPDIVLTSSVERIDAVASGGTYVVNVGCSSGEWTAFAADDCNTWVSVQVTGSLERTGTAEITVLPNNGTVSRNGSVTIRGGTKRLVLPLVQAVPMSVSQLVINSNSRGERFNIAVTTTGEWSVKSNNGWIGVEKTSNNAARVTTEANNALTFRNGSIEFVSGAEKITVTVRQESAEDREINAPEGYRLVWHDEFNEGQVLGSDWTHEVQNAGWVNNELQNYVNGSADGKRVTELVDGKLNINCFKGSNGSIYSGRVYAKVTEGWLYGYFEARILLPSGKGTWPAFWMMPANNNFATNPWPGCGEIDIMEEVGADPNIVSSSIHTAAYNHTINTQKTAARNIGTAESEYHVYACEWTPNYLRFFVDGVELMNFPNEGAGRNVWPFTYHFYPILNLAWGGMWGGYQGVDESALPVTMKVDYVRVFQKN